MFCFKILCSVCVMITVYVVLLATSLCAPLLITTMFGSMDTISIPFPLTKNTLTVTLYLSHILVLFVGFIMLYCWKSSKKRLFCLDFTDPEIQNHETYLKEFQFKRCHGLPPRQTILYCSSLSIGVYLFHDATRSSMREVASKATAMDFISTCNHCITSSCLFSY